MRDIDRQPHALPDALRRTHSDTLRCCGSHVHRGAIGDAIGAPSATPSATPSAAPSATPSARGHFAVTGAMSVARVGHTATLLRDGRVLIAGGSDASRGNPVLRTAELYDPATGKFSPAGSMVVARQGHDATLLRDGRVLVTGGHSDELGAHQLASAELYDPATGKFSPTAMAGFEVRTATLLNDGRVLVTRTESSQSGGPLVSGELYDPATGEFGGSTMGWIVLPRTASLLKDGRVLLAGGYVQGAYGEVPDMAELYDPSTGTFYPTGSMTTGRVNYSATVLPDNRVLLARGGDASSLPLGVLYGAGLGSAELYDPATGMFVPAAPMNVARSSHLATLLQDGRVPITGGCIDQNRCGLASAELFSL